MLALDSSIGCIEVSESEILDLYRSATITRNSAPDARPETMETYLCAIKKKPQQVKVYLAFVVNDRKIYVYTSPGKGKSEQEYPNEVEEALGYATSMGFSLDRVDLSYSPAMREVVVRNTKILRLPGTKAKSSLKHGLAGAPVLPLPRPGTNLPQKASADSPSPSPQPAPESTATESGKKGSSADVAELRKALAGLKQERQALLAERDALATRLGQASAQHLQSVQELANMVESQAQLAAERDTLLPFRKQVVELLPARDAENARLREQVADLGRKLEQAAGRHADLEREHGAMVDNLAQARQEMARLAAERDLERERAGLAQRHQVESASQFDEMRREMAQVKSAAESASRRAGELEERKGSLERELAGLRLELDRVGAERDAASGRAAALEEQREPAESELGDLRHELARTAAERDAAQQRAALLEERKEPDQSELAELRREFGRVSAEREAALERVSALQGKQGEAEAEMAVLRGELEELRAELRQVTEEGQAAAAAASALNLSPASLPQDEQFPPRILQGLNDSAFTERTLPPFEDLDAPQEEHAWNTPEPAQVGSPSGAGVEFPSMGEPASYFVPLGELQGGSFSGEEEGEAVRFHLESGLAAIDCPSPEDVLELHHSINNAYLSPEGTGGQESCQGYICCLRNKDQRQVFAAIYGAKSRRTRVYLPETQPLDDQSYARTLKGAISLAEEVGLMMERVPLEEEGRKRGERLKRCPVLRMSGGK